MNKNNEKVSLSMLRLLSISLLLILPLQSFASTVYTVRLAVYNNIDSLHDKVNKLSPALRKTIQIKKRGDQHVASSVESDKKEVLQKLLPSYQKVFPDAFISAEEKVDTKMPEAVAIEPKEVNNTTAKTEENKAQTEVEKNIGTEQNATLEEPKIIYNPYSRKVVDPLNKDLSFYDRLHQKTLYLCAYGPEEWSPNVLIHIAFFDKEVIYTPIMGDVSSKKEQYLVKEDKLYISHHGVFDPDMYNRIEEITEDYYLISTWIKEKKMTSIRYYFDLDKAEVYVKTLK
jgi:hypothetical protein